MRPLCRALMLSAAIGAFPGHAWAQAAATPAATIATPSPAAALAPVKPIDLFDGRSLAGWTFVARNAANPGAIWAVKDAVITCAGKPNGYARTVATYRDYALHVEWRWPEKAGNSGVFVHVNGPDKVWPACFEIQLKAGDAGSIRANGGAKVRELDPKAKDPINVALQHPGVEKPVGEWNSADITCRGDTISVVINGTLENRVTGTSADAGAIALQAEGAPVEFRNVRLKPLSPR
jgi:hypothetical protein